MRGDPLSQAVNRRDFMKFTGGGLAAGVVGSTALLEFLAACQQQAQTGQTGQSLTIGIANEPGTVDPAFVSAYRDNEVLKNISSSWLQYENIIDSGQGYSTVDTSKVVGDALLSYTIDPDGLTAHFVCRPNVKFPVSGNPMTADDFIGTLQRYTDMNANGLFGFHVAGIDSVASLTKTGPLTFDAKLKASPVFGPGLALGSTPVEDVKDMLAHKTADDPYSNKWAARNYSENGPYVLSAWNIGSSLVLKANPNFWGPPAKLYFSTITLQVVPSADQRLLLLKNGTIDIAEDLSVDFASQLQGVPGINVVALPSLLQWMFGLVFDKSKFSDVRVRQAVSAAIDYDSLVKDVLHGYGTAPTGVWPQNARWAQTSVSNNPFKFDPTKAKQLLSAAGVGSGFSFTCEIIDNDTEGAALAVAVQTMLRNVGITMNISKQQSGAFNDHLTKRSMDAWLQKNGAFVDDPYYFLNLWYTGNGLTKAASPHNLDWTNYDNPTINSLSDQLRTEPDEAKRKTLAAQAQTILNQDIPCINIADSKFLLGSKSDVKGIVKGPDDLIWYKYMHRG
jgi:peptide/nickel transport system substrate-binding protein